MFQIEMIIWIIATLCVIIIPCIRLGHKLFVVSSKIDDTIQHEVDKIATQEQQKYDLIHEKYIEQMHNISASLDQTSRFESIDVSVQDDPQSDIKWSPDPLSAQKQNSSHLSEVSQEVSQLENYSATYSPTDTWTNTSTESFHPQISTDPTSANSQPSTQTPHPKTATILDQAQITISGKTLDDQLKDKKNKLLQQIKQEYKLLADKSDTTAIERKLLEWLAIDSLDKDLTTWLADLYFWTQNNKKALTLLKKNFESNPSDHKILRQISEIHIRQGEHDQAQILISQALSASKDNPKYYMTQAEAFYRSGDMPSATYAIQQAVRLRPSNKEYLFALADMYERIGEQKQAKEIYYRLFELDPLNVTIKEKIADLKTYQ